MLTPLQPTALKAPFLEQFTDDWEDRWKPSHAKKDVKSDDEEWAYVGTWSAEEPSVFKGMEGDKGLVIKDKAAHHAISAKFPKAIDNKDNTLVVQYEVKLQSTLAAQSSSQQDTDSDRRPRVRWRLHEAAPGQRGSAR
jgi:calnexin